MGAPHKQISPAQAVAFYAGALAKTADDFCETFDHAEPSKRAVDDFLAVAVMAIARIEDAYGNLCDEPPPEEQPDGLDLF